MDEEKEELIQYILDYFTETHFKFEEDMEIESPKGKMNEFIDLLHKFHKFPSHHEISEAIYRMRQAFIGGDLNLIKIYLSISEKITTNSNTLVFKMDKTNATASLFDLHGIIDEIILPRTIKHKQEYLITSITGISPYVKKLKFTEDSAVETIYGNTFKNFGGRIKIKEICFPASLKELKEGWCCGTGKLTKIQISPSNGQFIYKEDKYLLGKSDPNKEEFDVLLFARRDIEEISIPSNIKIISSYAFENCKNLGEVKISPKSNLQRIGQDAFRSTSIMKIYIPSKVSII